jgi:hypothetical protein
MTKEGFSQYGYKIGYSDEKEGQPFQVDLLVSR